MLRARGRWAAGAWVVMAVAVAGVECQPPFDDVRFGALYIDDRPAVLIPLCPGDEVSGVSVIQGRGVGESYSEVVLWQAKQPLTATARGGLVLLGGDQFGEVLVPAPVPFPTARTDVQVTTTQGRHFSDIYAIYGSPPRYSSPAPAIADLTTQIRVDVRTVTQLSYQELQARFVRDAAGCPTRRAR